MPYNATVSLDALSVSTNRPSVPSSVVTITVSSQRRQTRPFIGTIAQLAADECVSDRFCHDGRGKQEPVDLADVRDVGRVVGA